jgi:hypothetical protein
MPKSEKKPNGLSSGASRPPSVMKLIFFDYRKTRSKRQLLRRCEAVAHLPLMMT